MKTLRDLLVSLLNATMMLAIILVACSILLVERVSQFRDETVQIVTQAVKPQREKLEGISAGLRSMESRLASAGNIDASNLRALSDLRENLPQMSDVECVAKQAMVRQLARHIGTALTGSANIE